MKLVSINTALFEKYKGDPEILTKSGRPYVLVIRRERKIFCVYGKNSSLIRNRYV